MFLFPFHENVLGFKNNFYLYVLTPFFPFAQALPSCGVF
jgi:hypothetical protein